MLQGFQVTHLCPPKAYSNFFNLMNLVVLMLPLTERMPRRYAVMAHILALHH
jgi:hypothetical protein